MSDDPTRTLERRISAALHTEVDDITPGADSLGPIRGRARAARRRRRVVVAVAAAVAVAALVVSMPAFRDDGSNVSTRPDPAPTTSTPPVPAPSSEAMERALWPDPAGPEQFVDPAAAARSFVAAVFGVADPPLSEVRTAGEDEAEIDVLDRSESGATLDTVASTLSLARLDGGHWYVTGARSDDVEIGSPAPGAPAVSPLTVSGEGRGYEGTILVEVRRRTAGAPVVADGFDTAGAGEARAPFSVDLTLPGPNGTAAGAILVARDSSGSELAVPHLSAQLTWLPGATEPPPASPTPSDGGVTPTTAGDPGAAFELGAQPLWPFSTFAEAEDWRATSGEGHQPWHADAVDTASLFTTSYLGFTEINEITSTDVRADEAWIGVGYRADAALPASTSAVVHLVRFGPHADSPWEVVGTRDSTLTLDTPRYGTRVSSPAPVGGTVTGVDECLVVQVHQPSSGAPLGEAPCVPAGGVGSPWQTTVTWSGASDPALTIVVWTGGHAQGVEMFAVTGVPG